MSGQVGNNWVPLAGVSVLFVGGAVASLLAGENTGAVAAYFVVATLVLILVAGPWLVRNPPAINANSGTYLVLAVALELGTVVLELGTVALELGIVTLELGTVAL